MRRPECGIISCLPLGWGRYWSDTPTTWCLRSCYRGGGRKRWWWSVSPSSSDKVESRTASGCRFSRWLNFGGRRDKAGKRRRSTVLGSDSLCCTCIPLEVVIHMVFHVIALSSTAHCARLGVRPSPDICILRVWAQSLMTTNDGSSSHR